MSVSRKSRLKDEGGGEEQPVSKRLRPGRNSSLSQTDQIKICQELYEVLRTQKTEGGRLLCQAFIRAPSRRNAPDYYEVVQTPIDLMRMHAKLKAEEYRSVEQLMGDVELMVENARAFYKPAQQEYRDAVEILDLVTSSRDRMVAAANESAQNDAEMRSREPSPVPSSRGLQSRSPSISTRSKDASPSRLGFSGGDPLARCHQEELLAAVLTYEEDERILSEPLRLLPSKSSYPEYYERIHNPIDLKTISAKLLADKYGTLNELERDLLVLCSNARKFNEPSSLIAKDAQRLRKFVSSKKSDVLDKAVVPIESSRAVKNMETIAEIANLSNSANTEEFSEDETEEQVEVNLCDPLWRLYMSVRCYKDGDGNHTIDPFLRLPSHEIYPDYYEDTAKPISLFMIKRKLRQGKYATIMSLVSDLNLMCENAKAYNIECSKIFITACEVQNLVAQNFGRFQIGQQITLDTTEIPVQQISPHAGALSPSNRPETAKKPATSTRHRRRREPAADSDHVRRGRKSMDELQERYRTSLNELLNSVVGFKDEQGRLLSETFLKNPDPNMYPGYYKLIANPIDLTIVKGNVESDKYESILSLASDLELVFQNAKNYNEPKSQIFADAAMLEGVMKTSLDHVGRCLESPRVVKERCGWRNTTIKGNLGASSAVSPRARTAKAPEAVARMASPDSFFGGPSSGINNLQKKQFDLFTTIRDFVDPSGRKLSAIFLKLPSKLEYPDYYEIVRRPIDLTRIQTKLQRNEYDSLESLVSDFSLMFDNACNYNDPDSLIYKDSLTLQSILLEKKQALRATDGNVQPPDVQAEVQDMLLQLFVAVHNCLDEEGRCLSDSLAELCEFLKVEGLDERSMRQWTLDYIKKNLDRGRYRRLDKFQEDMFELLDKARELSRSDSQLFEDAAELQITFIRKRNELCKNGEWFSSPALAYTESALCKDIDRQRREKEGEEKKSEADKPVDPKTTLQTQRVGDIEMTEIDIADTKYRIGDFCFVMPTDGRTESHIMRIERVWQDGELKKSFVSGNWYYRPSETYHLATRRFLEKEVFKSVFYDTVEIDRISGRCYVMFVKEYFKYRPIGFADDSIFVCESAYLGRVKHFKKIKQWAGNTAGVELEEREVPLLPVRIPSVFAAKSSAQSSPLVSSDVPATEASAELEADVACDENSRASSSTSSVLDRERENIDIANFVDGEKGCTYYAQYKWNRVFYKPGDSVYIPNINCAADGNTERDTNILRIDRIYEDASSQAFVFGQIFVRPADFEHEPTRMFYKHEVLMASREDAVPMSETGGRCEVMTLKDYCTFRPTEVVEADVYVCEHKLVADVAVTEDSNDGDCSGLGVGVGEKAKPIKTLKHYKPHSSVLDYEYYYFRQPIVPEKEASPLLATAQVKHEIDIDDLLANMEFPTVPATGVVVASQESNSPLTPMSQSFMKNSHAKSKSGYILYSAEVRKRIMNDNPECSFGEISRMVGQKWKNLPTDTKKIYEERAQILSEERQRKAATIPTRTIPNGQIQAWLCRWNNCEYMFETAEQLAQHINGPGGHTSQREDCEPNSFPCFWYNCNKYRKDGRPFSSQPKLHRHVKEKHMANSMRLVDSKHRQSKFYIPAQVNVTPPQPLDQQQDRSGSDMQQHSGGVRAYQHPQTSAGVMQPPNAQPQQVQIVYQMPDGQAQQGVAAQHIMSAAIPQQSAYQQQSTPAPNTPNAVPQHAFNPGRMIVTAPPEPVFIPPPQQHRVQRALHSEAYLRYIEGLHRPQQLTVSEFDKVLGANEMNTAAPADAKTDDWFAHAPGNRQEAMRAMWRLRDHLMKDSLMIDRVLTHTEY